MGPDVADRVEYTGRGEREVFDRRVDRWVVVDAYLFEVRYSGVIEFQVNPEFGSDEVARVEVDTYAPALGRLSAVMLSRVTEVEVNAGQELFGGNANGSILIHTGQGVKLHAGRLPRRGAVPREAAHASLDIDHADDPGWRAAQTADGEFISTYARDFPDREDVAESVLRYFAVSR